MSDAESTPQPFQMLGEAGVVCEGDACEVPPVVE